MHQMHPFHQQQQLDTAGQTIHQSHPPSQDSQVQYQEVNLKPKSQFTSIVPIPPAIHQRNKTLLNTLVNSSKFDTTLGFHTNKFCYLLQKQAADARNKNSESYGDDSSI
jgi:hypothetical protein